LLISKGRKGAAGTRAANAHAGIKSPGEFLFGLLVEGEGLKKGLVLGSREIKKAIRSRRRGEQKKKHP
jgi:hypothetical protein